LEKIDLYSAEPMSGILPASHEAVLLIQQAIRSRGLGPGDRLGTEAELAEEFGMTRAAVREGVRLLAQANLVRASRGPGGGVFVLHSPARGLAETVNASIATMLGSQVTTYGELIEVRMLLEVPLAGLAASRADAAAIERLHTCVDTAAAHPGEEAVQRATDEQFHWTIAAAAGNPVASALIAWSHVVLQPALKELIADAIVDPVAVEQHRGILAAIEARKASAAERAMRDHLRYVSDVLETVAPSSI
jgi:GntR family transcriptional regulator, transcriptional repressor for pyruvate dehydrogenase complex